MKKRITTNGVEALQKTFKQAYKVHRIMHFEHTYVQNEDEKFITEIVEYVKQNISSPDLSVEALSREMKMSRISLYRKILMFTGKSPVEFICTIRLHKAVQMLGTSQMRIGRIASEVGFNNPHYFARIFKREYNMLPSAYIHFARKTKALAILNDYGLTDEMKTIGSNDSRLAISF